MRSEERVFMQTQWNNLSQKVSLNRFPVLCICLCVLWMYSHRHFFSSRCIWCFSSGKSYVTSFTVIWSFILPWLLSQSWFFNCCFKSSSADSNSQFRKKVWLHHPSNQGLCGWQWYLHCTPYCLGKLNLFLTYSQRKLVIYLILIFCVRCICFLTATL